MPKRHTNKEEVRAYYETHNEELSALSKHFNIPVRTLSFWAKEEGWKKGGAIEGIAVEVLQKDLVKKEFGSVLLKESQNLKEQIRYNLGDTAFKIDSMILENLLDESTEKLLLSAMSLKVIQNNITLTALLAKDELLRLKSRSEEKGMPDPMVVAAAEKVQKMFIDMKTSIFGKEVLNTQENELDLQNLSDAELNALLNS
ncbi:hypothetical protein LS70_003860 [Helicobacter sp. MIT 11-5569]|uniref:hypothetical protein n=1 Tax=Helicobacter sp. MIT 11-5569 TaxID=1548151 RepID=UPI00051FD93E|nr:hypothetical protein [Helicobacter sp. MIT 11-5569]TLD83954.1 hypothetical protein LS70_003860 [Helicobacter sp. MIT 11-5569]